jgi:hypothetical protein
MAAIRLTVASLAFALLLGLTDTSKVRAAEFSDEAMALPFPPDAQLLEFTAWSRDISYTSPSPLKSLAAFYLKEMANRGWEHDESAARVEDDRIKLVFKHDNVKVEISLRQSSKGVEVDFDCDNLKFTGVDDPAKLTGAGIPVPQAALLIQKDYPLPEGAVNLQFKKEGCTFKSSLSLDDAFAYYMKLVPSKGFRESRKPILSDSRKYTEFKKGPVLVSVNIFTDPVGSRIILEYKDESRKTTVPALAAVASLPLKGITAEPASAGGSPAAPVGGSPVDVTSNKGSATVNYNGKQYTFKNVAAFQTRSRGAETTMLVFSARPVPLNKMQSMIVKDPGFSYGDLYEGANPDNLVVQLGKYMSFQFGIPGVGMSNSVDEPVNEMTVEGGRVRGTLKMAPTKLFSDTFGFTATIDAGILTPTTRVAGPADVVAKSDSPVVANSPIPFPDAVGNISSEGSKFRKTYHADVHLPLAEVIGFYRKELPAQGWKPVEGNAGGAMRFKNDAMDVVLTLKSQGDKTAVEAVTRDMAQARKEGVLPDAGKGRIVFGNGSEVSVVFTVGKTTHTLKPGQGARDYKQTVSNSLAPGSYTVTIKASGQAAQTEKIELTEGSTWGIIAMPMGGVLPIQLY